MDIDYGFKLIDANGDVVYDFTLPGVIIEGYDIGRYLEALKKNEEISIKEFRHVKIGNK